MLGQDIGSNVNRAKSRYKKLCGRGLVAIIVFCLMAVESEGQCPVSPSTVYQSGSGTYCPDSSFSIIVNAFTSQTYTFFHNGQPITGYVQLSNLTSGQSFLSYAVAHISPSDAGSYSVIAYDTCGDGNSLPLDTVMVYYAALTSLSIDQIKDTAASFHWSGGPPGSVFLWAIDTTNTFPTSGDSILSGMTTDSSAHVSGLKGSFKYYVFASIQNPNCSPTPVWVSNSFTTLSACTANFDSLPTISSNNPSYTICPGGKIVLQSNSSSGNQWFRDGVAIADSIGATIVLTDSGSYTVMVSDSDGCHATSPPVYVSITSAPAVPTITPSGALIFCEGDSVILSSSTANSYEWLRNDTVLAQTAQSLTVVGSGNYSVQVTNTGGCSATSVAVTVTVNALPAQPTITPSGPLTFCSGGSVVLSSSSSNSYSWLINDSPIGQTSQVLTATSSGNYTVQVTNAGGCSATSAAVIVTVNALPALPIITPSGPTTFCSGGSLTLSASLASSYIWSINDSAIGQTSQNITASSSGSYKVQVTNAGGCTATSASLAVTINPLPPVPMITPSGPLIFCAGGSVVLSSSAGYSYSWSINDSAIGQTGQSLTAIVSGSYTVEVTSAGGCSSASIPVAVNVNALPAIPVITPQGSLTFCTGGNVVLSSSSANSYAWFLNDTAIGQVGQNLTAINPGNYTVEVTNAGGCSATSSPVMINIFAQAPIPIITPLGPVTFCAGGSVALSSSSGNSYAWFRNDTAIGQTGQSPVFDFSGNYTVQVTDGSGCSATSAPVIVTVNAMEPTPTITALGALTFCTGGNVELSASPGNSYAWFRNDTAIGQTGQNPTFITTGNYTVEVTNAVGCSATSDPVAVFVNPVPPVPAISGRTILNSCSGDVDTLYSSAASGNQWLNNNSPVSGATNAFILVSTAGNYSVQVTGAGQCAAVSAVTTVTAIGSSPQPTISPSGTVTICAGDSTLLTSSLSSGNQWYQNGVALIGDTLPQLYVSASGNYTVLGDTGLCSSQSLPTIVSSSGSQATPVISVTGSLTICQGGSVLLQSSVPTGNQWYFDGQAIFGENNPGYNASASGDYIVSVGAGACQVFSTAVIVNEFAIPPVPVISYNNTNLCSGTVLLQSSVDTGNVWYLDTVAIPGATGLTYTVLAPGNYTVVASFGGNCSSQSAAVTITGSSGVVPMISFLHGVLSSDSVNGNQWFLNDSIIPGATGQTFTPKAAGSYTLQTNHIGCVSSFSAPQIVTTEDLTTPNVKIFPNPASDHLTIENNGANPVMIQLYDVTGRSLQTIQSISSTYLLLTAQLARGPYYILITDQVTKNKTRRLVLKL
jgi:hypothetical protein